MEKRKWTIGQAILWSSGYLAEKHSENARLVSEWLLAAQFGSERTQLYIRWNEVIPEEILSRFGAALRRIKQGEPLAYVLGYQPFFTLKISVTPDVLIPRTETEELVQWVVDDYRKEELDQPLQVLDLCTGSGAIAVSIAHFIDTAEITATDISPKALAIARTNAAEAAVSDRIRFLEGDFLDPVRDALDSFDIIICNPPYVAEQQKTMLDPQVAAFEPATALYGGADGLGFFRKVRAHFPLRKKTALYMEIAHDQKNALNHLFEGCGTIQWKQDLNQRWRMMKVVVE
jgi:release factor glutamine methyltransferase